MTSSFDHDPLDRSDSRAWRGALALSLALAAAAALAGCGANRVVANADNGSDARLRHPIALVQQPYTLDIFPGEDAPHRLDLHTSNQIATFAARYRQSGQGQISILVPRIGPRPLVGGATVDAIRRELARSGAAAAVTVSQYPVENPALASPVRMSFDALRAAVTHRCGDWPSDLASGSSTQGWENKSYWNFGCASQNMIATQVADPRDIAEPQGDTPPDAAIRMRGIAKVRAGADPSTGWAMKNSNIGAVGN